jgi:site-specific DNA-adenine methylase
MAHLQLCHYPGCKARLRSQILPFLLPLAEGVDNFVDVFAGAGGIALEMMYQRPDLVHVINDADPTMITLWLAVRDYPVELVERVERFIPSVGALYRGLPLWRRVTALPDSPEEIIEIAFLRLVHQTLSQSGMVDGGPRGGKYYRNYPMALKWKPARMKSIIRLCSQRLRFPGDVQISNCDFTPVVGATEGHKLLFCDPPYWPRTPDMPQRFYRNQFSVADHARLAEMLRLTPHRWFVMIGDHPRIRQAYEWATIIPITGSEILVTRDGGP